MEKLFREETRKAKKRKKSKATLSFAIDDEDCTAEDSSHHTPATDDGEIASKRAKFRKNPDVDTSFLPDREREEAERKERERLRVEWLQKQHELKTQDIEITYSYWDGSGHRKSVVVRPLCPLTLIAVANPFSSARKATRSATFWKSVATSSPSLGRSASTTSCMSR